jgi:hypothetical protein
LEFWDLENLKTRDGSLKVHKNTCAFAVLLGESVHQSASLGLVGEFGDALEGAQKEALRRDTASEDKEKRENCSVFVTNKLLKVPLATPMDPPNTYIYSYYSYSSI